MKAYGGFVWPESGPVTCSDFSPRAVCGYGLHGWLWATGDFNLRNKDPKAKWLVVEVDEKTVVKIDGGQKVKFPSGEVIYCGTHKPAYDLVMKWFWINHAKELAAMETISASTNVSDESEVSVVTTKEKVHASASGNSGHASASGDYGHASASGNSGHASASGDYGHASASGNYGHASASGYSGHASASGDYGHASASGYSGHACVLGNNGKAKCGENGALILTYWDGKRYRHVIGYAGENGIEAGKWYCLDDSKEFKLIEVPE